MKMNNCSSAMRLCIPLGASIALSLSMTGCSMTGSSAPSTGNSAAAAKNAGNFSNTVFLGDSLTAGFQNGSLLDTTQVHGWAPLVATQASFKIVQPLIAAPGAPAALKLISLGPSPVVQQESGVTTGRDNPTDQPTDLAVPGAYLTDIQSTAPLPVPVSDQDIITSLVLGYPGLAAGNDLSQTGFAVKAQPTTIFLWAGNNDALVADSSGQPSKMTSTADFTTQYQSLVQLLTAKTTAHLVIGNIPDVTALPYLQAAATVLALTSTQTGIPAATLSTTLGIQAGDFVNSKGLSEIQDIISGKQKGPIDDAGVLTAAEVITTQTQIAAYNTVIAQQAKAAAATLVDINALFKQIATNGVTINGVHGTAAFLGGIFSLDGVHPTNTGYAVVANAYIDTMNTAFNTKIPDADLSAISKADPLWPPNLAVGAARPGTAMLMPANAGKSIDDLLLRTPKPQQ